MVFVDQASGLYNNANDVRSIDAVAVTPVPCGDTDTATPVPCPPSLQIFGGEVNQGLSGYSLVAGKDTLVRVFVGAGLNLGVTTSALIIDRAELDVKNNTTGAVFTSTSAVINNPITNFNQQYSEHSNVNFYLNGPKLPAGDYQFTARLYSNSVTAIREFDFNGITYSLGPTADLRVLLVFGDDPTTERDSSGNPKPPLDYLGKDPDLSKDPVTLELHQESHTTHTLANLSDSKRHRDNRYECGLQWRP